MRNIFLQIYQKLADFGKLAAILKKLHLHVHFLWN